VPGFGDPPDDGPEDFGAEGADVGAAAGLDGSALLAAGSDAFDGESGTDGVPAAPADPLVSDSAAFL
jgi:hypothetical protein